jgi:DNA-directed RNA polymerase specialized sigma24 family protein
VVGPKEFLVEEESVMKRLREYQPAYATGEDFGRIFEEHMDRLYLLSLLLTGDHARARQCFVSALENTMEGPDVYMEFANSWARRAIIESAIQLLNFVRSEGNVAPAALEDASEHEIFAWEQPQILAILGLPSFERMVFVMAVLERYSNQESSVLLRCSRRDVIAALTRAFHQIGSSIKSFYEAECGVRGVGMASREESSIG